MKTNTIITIGRQYGSGGKEIGHFVAEAFGIKLYDKEMLARAAKESGICEELFETHDEKPTNSFLYSLVMDTYSMGYAGNTKKLADTIRAVLPSEDCDYFGAPGTAELHSEMLYVGFWTDKGNADSAVLQLLSKLRGKKVFLFGTAGFGGSAAYFQKILDHVKQSVDPSNTVVGEYMCQGKMPQSVRDRYIKMKAQPEHPANIDALIENFDSALSHPDEDDLERLRKIILG